MYIGIFLGMFWEKGRSDDGGVWVSEVVNMQVGILVEQGLMIAVVVGAY